MNKYIVPKYCESKLTVDNLLSIVLHDMNQIRLILLVRGTLELFIGLSGMEVPLLQRLFRKQVHCW